MYRVLGENIQRTLWEVRGISIASSYRVNDERKDSGLHARISTHPRHIQGKMHSEYCDDEGQ